MNPATITDRYQVIARKYRPQTFFDVVGQEATVVTLKNALRFNKVAHAYLFCGCRGTGKTTLARVFSKALNCQQPTSDFEPCNSCQSCIEVSQGRSLDVLEIDGASHRGIDDIRQINETISYAPSCGKYKIYIIDEVHMLTKEAFNALLKTLEEPPSNVKFFFATTEPHKVLQTIMSRCQRFDLTRITLPLIQQKLEKIGNDLNLQYDSDAIQLIAKLSEGSLRDAESLFDQVLCYNEGTLTTEKIYSSLGLISSSTFFALDKAFDDQDLSYAFILAEQIFSSGKELSYFLDSLMEHYRTILSLQLGQPHTLSQAQAKSYEYAASKGYTQDHVLYILDYLLGWMQQISKSTFKRISVEMILLHIIRSKQRISIDTLVKRLHHIQKELPTRFPIYSDAVADPLEIKQIEDTTSPKSNTYSSRVEDESNLQPISPIVEQPTQHEISPPAAKVAEEIVSTTREETSRKVTKPSAKHETIIRFAAVELEGVFAKN